MDKNRNCSACNIKLDKDHYKRDRTVCKDCYNKKKRNSNNKTLIQNHQPKIEKVNKNNNNNRILSVGPPFSGKTYLKLIIVSRIPDRDIYVINKSPPEQNSYSKIKIKETGERKSVNEYENGIIVFDDILGSSNSRYIDQFFIRGRNINLDIYYLSQSQFDLTKRSIRNNSNKIILFNQTLKDIENIYTKTLLDMIRVMMNLKNYVESLGKRIIIISVLIDLKREIKEDIVFVMRTKTLI